jgi:hypothetical protein
VPSAGRHLVRVVDDENNETTAQIYDAEGKKVCQAGYLCEFAAAGRYTLIAGWQEVFDYEYATVFTSPRAAGCVPVGDQGLTAGAYRGSFTTIGETDCLQLPSPAGAMISINLPPRAKGAARPEWRLINGNGESLCVTDGCALSGPAPYRILLNGPEDSGPGDYAIVVQRQDRVNDCAVLPAGKIGDNVGVIAAFSAGRFASCWSIPAGQHGASDIIGFAPVSGSGTGWAGVTVTDGTGRTVCGGSFFASSQLLRCTYAPGEAYTLVMTAAPADFQYRLSRKDSSPATARCETPVNTVLGGPAMSGTLVRDEEVRCYRVTPKSTAEAYWLGVRSTEYSARYWVTDAAGTSRCSGYVVPCQVSGSTSYQVFIWSSKDGVQVPYRLDTWYLGANGQPPAQCPAVAGVPAIGPLTGTLTEQKTAVCVSVPVNNFSDFTVDITNTAGGEETPEPYYFHTRNETSGLTGCSYASGGRGCLVTMPFPQRSGMAMFVLAPKTENANLPFRAEIVCEEGEVCTAPYALGSVSPMRVPNGGVATLTLRGSGLTTGDSVMLTRTGAPSIVATIKSASAGVMTVTADVTGATPGAWNVVARTADGWPEATLTGGLTVTAAPIRVTRAPSISGTVRVGGTVRAVVGGWSPSPSSYSYQWTANGVAIKQAVGTSYAIPAAMRGKRLAVIVTAKRANRADTPAVSGALTVGYGTAPAATTKPKITGSVRAGKKVTASAGAWSPRADSYRYEWRVNGKLVATTATLKIKKSWAGRKLTVVVIAKKAGHHDGRATSAAVKIKR